MDKHFSHTENMFWARTCAFWSKKCCSKTERLDFINFIQRYLCCYFFVSFSYGLKWQITFLDNYAVLKFRVGNCVRHIIVAHMNFCQPKGGLYERYKSVAHTCRTQIWTSRKRVVYSNMYETNDHGDEKQCIVLLLKSIQLLLLFIHNTCCLFLTKIVVCNEDCFASSNKMMIRSKPSVLVVVSMR